MLGKIRRNKKRNEHITEGQIREKRREKRDHKIREERREDKEERIEENGKEDQKRGR
jgi:hypothetical protein